MDVSDVPDPANTPPTSRRCTAHVVRGSAVFGATSGRVIVESGSLVRIAEADWPQDVLFNSTYAALVMEQFGVNDLN